MANLLTMNNAANNTARRTATKTGHQTYTYRGAEIAKVAGSDAWVATMPDGRRTSLYRLADAKNWIDAWSEA